MILVTGGAGFIGSNLVAELVEAGRRVTVNDTLDGEHKRRNLAHHQPEEVVAPSGLEAFLERRGGDIEVIYHLGAITSTAETDTRELYRTNVALSQRVWRWCADRGVPLVYASSAATYGDGTGGFIDADDPASLARLVPLNPYGRSKHAFDSWVAAEVAEGRPTPPLWFGLKLFNVYGPNEYHKGDMRSGVAKAYRGAAGGEAATLFRSHRPDVPDGGQKRDFVYVRDCVDVMRWLPRTGAPAGIYNVGTGRAESWLDLMEALYDAVGHPLRIRWTETPPEIREGYQYFTRAPIEKLRAAGYTGDFATVREGVREYVDRFLSRPDPYR